MMSTQSNVKPYPAAFREKVVQLAGKVVLLVWTTDRQS